MEFSKIVCRYLKKCNVRISNRYFRQRMQSHPDYPSLVSLTDTLDETGLPYAAVIVDKEKYRELQYPLLAHSKQKNTREDFILVQSPTQFEKDGTFFSEWDGITLIIQPGSKIDYADHNKQFATERKENRLLLVSLLAVAAIFLSVFLIHFSAPFFLLMILSLGGLVITSLITLHNMGMDVAITEQLCSADGDNGCDKVLHSKAATILKGLGLSDAGLIYFMALSIFLFLFTLSAGATLSLLIASVFGIGVLCSVLSIFYQWLVLKSWCRLCLLVAGVTGLQFLVLVGNMRLLTGNSSGNILFILGVLLVSFLISSIIWYFGKQTITRSEDVLKKDINIAKWRRNPEVFLSLLSKQRKISGRKWENDIFLGDPNADVQIIVACSPYCFPCADAHKELSEILRLYKQAVGITIRLAIRSTAADDKRAIAAVHILDAYMNGSVAHGADSSDREECIEDWFSLMDLALFKQKYPKTVDHEEHRPLLETHKKWGEEIKITHTPTIFIQGHELPKQYKVSDLKLLMTHIIDDIMLQPVVANAEL
jgi:uncharacterized membrane protein